MEMIDWLFGVLWVLPGAVLGIVVTLAVQALASCYANWGVKVKDDDAAPFKAKASAKAIGMRRQNRSTPCKDDDDDMEYIGYMSTTRKVHRNQTCSGMLKAEPIQLCSKCFKYL